MHILSGKVKPGKKRGKTLGFPTANIDVDTTIPEGIYISETTFNDKTYPSVTFIGVARTFQATEFISETYILHYSDELYNKDLTITLIKKIRNNEIFKNKDDLIKAMENDVAKAKEYFGIKA